MGRFRWLELGEPPPSASGPPAGPGRGDMNEFTCLASGDECLRQGEHEAALKWYSRALRYALDVEGAWLGQVRCLLHLEENAEANIWADRALERFQDSPDLLAAKAMALSRTRGVRAAMPYSDASLTVKGRAVGPYPWIVRGDLLLDAGGKRESALRCFSQAVAVSKGDWYIRYLVGECFLRKGMTAQALLRFSEGAKLDRSNPVLLCAVGLCHERLGEVRAAVSDYQQALHADPRCKTAKQRLAALQGVGPLRRLWRLLRGRG